MKKSYVSFTAMVLLGSTSLMAYTLEKSFKSGAIEGSIGAYGQQFDHKDANKDGFSNGHASINYETAPFHNVSLGMGAWGSTQLSEKNDGDYDAMIADKGVIHQAYIKYGDGELIKAVAGRQEVDFMWMTDFIEGATIELGYIDNLVLTMAWAKKNAVVGPDEVGEFTNMNGNKGVYMVDAKYTPVEWLEINPFFYYAADLVKAPGIKTTLSFEPHEELKTKTMVAYTKGNSDVVGTPDGYVAQFEQGLAFMGATFALGYIKTDKDGTAGLESFGDQMPFEEGNFALSQNAKTAYISASYKIEEIGITLSALYGETQYFDADSSQKFKEKELNLSMGYEIFKGLETSLMYANVKNNGVGTDPDADTYNAIKAFVEYKF